VNLKYHNSSNLTSSLTSKEEHTLRVFGNRVLRRRVGPERGEVTGEWMRDEDLNIVYPSLNIIGIIKSRKGEMGRTCSIRRFGLKTRREETTRTT
jgi:hypothetical protein